LRKEGYAQDLTILLREYLLSGESDRISEYLTSKSNLPGPRGNLELAHAFADLAGSLSESASEKAWTLCLKFIGVGPDEAPAGDPREFLPFCGAVAVGAIGSSHSKYYRRALSCLKGLAEDPRWRTREGVAMGIQRLMSKSGIGTIDELKGWIEDEKWLAMRAAAAGVAEPALLKDSEAARGALELHRAIFSKMLGSRERKSGEFKTLKQGLGYTLSVVVSSLPDEGFQYIRRLIESGDRDILRIVEENLKKSRLTKRYAEEVDEIKDLLKKGGA